MNFLRRMKHEIPSVCVVHCSGLARTVAFAQSDAHKMAEPEAPAPKSEAQTSFEAMKTLAGDWEGPVKTDMPVEAKVDIKPLHVSMRVTSRGNVLVHEF